VVYLYKLTTCIFIFFITPCLGRSPILKCSQQPLSKSAHKDIQSQVRKSVEFSQVKALNAQSLKVSVARCENTQGQVYASFISLPKIEGKSCSINSMTFPFQVVEDKVRFDPFLSQTNLSLELLEKNIRKALEKNSFFESSHFCQIEFYDNNSWIIQLRNKSKKYCFLRANFDGSKVEVIKRLYAKNSECS
jgi:hypothetical protein